MGAASGAGLPLRLQAHKWAEFEPPSTHPFGADLQANGDCCCLASQNLPFGN